MMRGLFASPVPHRLLDAFWEGMRFDCLITIGKINP